MGRHFQISTENAIPVLIVKDLISETANREIVKAVESKMVEGFPDLVVDLSDIRYMNRVGINFLINIRRRSEGLGGKIAVIHASRKVEQLLDITKLRSMFFLTDSLDDALAFIAAS